MKSHNGRGIARERGKQVDRTAGYSNNEEALRRKFGMGPGPNGLESAGGITGDRRGMVDTVWCCRENLRTRHATLKNLPDPEDRGNCFINSL